jgi:hypothetical protein
MRLGRMMGAYQSYPFLPVCNEPITCEKYGYILLWLATLLQHVASTLIKLITNIAVAHLPDPDRGHSPAAVSHHHLLV